jgi:hypothetical protein
MKKRMFLAVLLGLLVALAPMAALAQGVTPGTGKTNVFMQNLGAADAQVNVTFYRQDTGDPDWTYTIPDPIPSKGSRYLLYTQFGVGDNWAGAAELAATEPLAAIVNMFWDGSGSTSATAATYTGVDNPATEVYLAGLAKSSVRQTRVSVQNTENTAANVALRFYDRSGTLTGTLNDNIPAKAEKTYVLDQIAQADFAATGGNGSLYITSNTKIAAMASVHSPTWSAAYSGASTGDTTVWVPGVFRRAVGGVWQLFSAMTIQNLGNVPANIMVEMIGIPGRASTSWTDTIPAKASYGINTASVGQMDPTKWATAMNILGTNWQGSAKITCTNGQQLTGAGFYFLPAAVPDILGYNAIRASDATSNAISMPAVYRRTTGTNQIYSTTLVQNLNNTAGTLNVKFFSAAGTPAGNPAGYNVALPADSSIRLNLLAGLELPAQALTDLGDAFTGAMYIESTSGNSIIAVTNIVYSSLARASGYPGFPLQ